jgi:glycosyltransferase involved in cell wall biosynthesis
MKITFVLPGIGFGGGKRAIFECANRLIDRGHRVKIVYPLCLVRFKKNYSLMDWLEIGAIFLLRFFLGKRVRWFSLKAELVRIPCFSPIFASWLPEADVVVATAAETAEFVSRLHGKNGKKFYFVQHYEAWELWNNDDCWKWIINQPGSMKENSMEIVTKELADPLLRKYRERINQTYHLPMKIFTTSTWLKELLETKMGVKVIGRVDIGNDYEFFAAGSGEERDGRTILMLFRGADWKGDDDGLRALEIVKREKSDVRVILLGRNIYRHSAPDWVEYHADISDEQLRKLYSGASVFILPSWVEGWSSPPMEAMSCGTACVCTDVGAVSDYAVPGETVFLVPPHNPVALAESCLALLLDPQKRHNIGQAAQKYIKKYTWDRTVEQMEMIFERA